VVYVSDLEHLGIERLNAASEMSLQYYGQPLIITDSGGKDSSVVKELALRSGIPFEIMDVGFLPFAMLYRDESGQTKQEWRKFQREWANSYIVGRKFMERRKDGNKTDV
jgi:3'-phosphoadenosine 5'-phosphosulfate sulfotransferase (PAPS reductase)/FAD synthetase